MGIAFLLAALQVGTVITGETSLRFDHDGVNTEKYLLCSALAGECRDQVVESAGAGSLKFVAPRWLPRGEQVLTVIAVSPDELQSEPSEDKSFRVFVKPGRPGFLRVEEE